MPPFRPDLIAYINLDSRPDRRAHMERQLSAASAPVERIAATRLETAPESHGLAMAPGLEGHRGAASIWLSHRAALERALARPGDGAFLLLEDDVVFDPGVWTRDPGLGALPEDWDIALVTPRFRARRPGLRDWLARRTGMAGVAFARPQRRMRPEPAARYLPDYFVTGAHFTIFRDRGAVARVLAALDAAPGLSHVDTYYAELPGCWLITDPRIRAGRFGSDQ